MFVFEKYLTGKTVAKNGILKRPFLIPVSYLILKTVNSETVETVET